MYTKYYGLNAQPFRLTPDPNFFFNSTPHKSALAYLRYGMQLGEGFIVVTGAAGTGKTTLSLALLGSLSRSDMVIGELVTTQLQDEDLLRSIAAAFKLDARGAKSDLILRLQGFFTARAQAAKQVLLVVDEAHNLPQSSFEELRMLTNLHRGSQALLQCILLGQPPLRDILAQANMEQLQQRVIATHHLHPLSLAETRDYILHRLQQAGWRGDPSFTAEAIQHIYQYTQGIPRIINALCNRILLFGYIEEKHQIDASDAIQVYNEWEQELGHIDSPQLFRAPQLNETNTDAIAQEHVTLGRAVGANSYSFRDAPDAHASVSTKAKPNASDIASLNAISTTVRNNAGIHSPPSGASLTVAKIPSGAAQSQPTFTKQISSDPFSRPLSKNSSLLLPFTAFLVVLVVISMIFSVYNSESKIATKIETPPPTKHAAMPHTELKMIKGHKPETSTPETDHSLLSSTARLQPEQVVSPEIGTKNTSSITSTTAMENTPPTRDIPATHTPQHAMTETDFAALASQEETNPQTEATQHDIRSVKNSRAHMNKSHLNKTKVTSLASQLKAKPPIKSMARDSRALHVPKVTVKNAKVNLPAQQPETKHSPEPSADDSRAVNTPQDNVTATNVAVLTQPPQVKTPFPPETQIAITKDTPRIKTLPQAIAITPQTSLKAGIGITSANLSQQPTESSDSPDSTALTPNKITEAPKDLPISKDKLSAMLSLFRWAYDNGDMDTLEQLFASDARSDEDNNRTAIAHSYQKLFNITDKRRLVLNDIRWSSAGDAVQGEGRFAISLKEKGRNWTSSYNGKITLRVEKRDGQLLIKALNQSYTQ